VDVGLVLPAHVPWETLAGVASRAERLGFASLWLADQPAHPDSVRLDPLVGLAGLARLTSVARIGALLAPDLRPPAVVAKVLSTIDVLSGGRVVVVLDGVGPGVVEADTLGEAVQVMRGAFGGGPFTFHGVHHQVEALRCRPRPLQQPAPPLWVSGAGPLLLAAAARHADGWGPSGSAVTPEDYRHLARSIDRACQESGRDPASLHRFVRQDPAVGSESQVRQQLSGWAETGVATLLLDAGEVVSGATSGDDPEEELEILASAVSLPTKGGP